MNIDLFRDGLFCGHFRDIPDRPGPVYLCHEAGFPEDPPIRRVRILIWSKPRKGDPGKRPAPRNVLVENVELGPPGSERQWIRPFRGLLREEHKGEQRELPWI